MLTVEEWNALIEIVNRVGQNTRPPSPSEVLWVNSLRARVVEPDAPTELPQVPPQAPQEQQGR